MKFVIQRVTKASVTVDGTCIGSIGKGFLVLIGVGAEDTKEVADKYVKKLLGLRIFEDAGVIEFIEKYPDICPEFNSIYKERRTVLANRDLDTRERWYM